MSASPQGWFARLKAYAAGTSIQTKLVFANAFVALVAGCLLITGMVVYLNRMLSDHLSEDLKGRAALVSDAAGAAIAFNDRAAAAEALQSLRRFEDFRCAALYDPQGQLFASALSNEEYRSELPNKVSDAIAMHGRHFDFLSPITYRSASLGWVYIRSDRTALQSMLMNELVIIALIGIVTLALALAAISVVLSRVSRPLRNLAGLMKQVSQTGDYRLRASLDQLGYFERQGTQSRDEVHHLARAFNSMLAQIETRDGALEKELEIRLRIQKRLDFMAHHDSLTTLPNRTVFRSHISQACERASRTDRQVAVLFVDLDNFKGINDTLGHAVGDSLLTAVASAIKSEVRSNDLVARLGGDEFGVVIEHRRILRSAEVVSEKILGLLRKPFEIEGKSIHVTASIGIAVSPDHGTDADTLVRNADAAMYAAKDKGRNQARVFTQDLNHRAVEKLKIENALRHAIERNEFSLRFQPQMSMRDQHIIAAEALLRWDSAELGVINPEEFIPIAEEAGLIRDIGAWVIGESCAQLGRWKAEGFPDIRVAINISGIQVADAFLPTIIAHALDEHNIAPHLVEMEITETVLVAATEQNASVIAHLRDLGVRIAIDDFGIGYSSMSYLGRMPAHAIKIDRSFVASCLDRKEDAAIVGAVAALGRGLNLEVIAEGIESQAQLDMLTDIGCDTLQGYYIARPMRAEELVEFVKQQRERLPKPKRSSLRLA